MHRRNNRAVQARGLTHTWLQLFLVVLILSSCSPFPGLPLTPTCTCSAFAVAASHVAASPASMKPLAFRGASSRSSVTQSTTTGTKLHALIPITDFVIGPVVQSSLVFAGCNAVGWLISLVTKSHLHLDLIGTGAFAAAGILPFLTDSSRGISASGRIKLSSAMVTVWGSKLAGFLFFRALKTGHDARLDELLSTSSGASEFLLKTLFKIVFLKCCTRCAVQMSSWVLASFILTYRISITRQLVSGFFPCFGVS